MTRPSGGLDGYPELPAREFEIDEIEQSVARLIGDSPINELDVATKALVAEHYIDLARAYDGKGNREGAVKAIDQAIELYAQLEQEDSTLTALWRESLAGARSQRERIENE
ncbi:MAG: hypothetical protein GY715_04610 [Planctomycetes bacterium]|nr:hypothetical protein [Planctomycetota bacterium]